MTVVVCGLITRVLSLTVLRIILALLLITTHLAGIH